MRKAGGKTNESDCLLWACLLLSGQVFIDNHRNTA